MRTTLLLLGALLLPVAVAADVSDCYAPGMTTWARQRCEINEHEAQERAFRAETDCSFYTTLYDRYNCARYGSPGNAGELRRQRDNPTIIVNPPPVIIRREDFRGFGDW